MRQKRKLLITLLVLTVIIGILLFSAIVRVFMQQPDENASPIMFSENVYVILVFAILLPIFLGVMIKHIVKTHNEYFDAIRDQEIETPKAKSAPKVSLEHSEMPVTLGFAAPQGPAEEKKELEDEIARLKSKSEILEQKVAEFKEKTVDNLRMLFVNCWKMI